MFKSIYKPLQLVPAVQPILLLMTLIAIIMPQTFKTALTSFFPFFKTNPFGAEEVVLMYKLLTPLYLGANSFDNILTFKNKAIVPIIYGLWNSVTYLLLYLLFIAFKDMSTIIWQLKENVLESFVFVIGLVVFLNDKVDILKKLYKYSNNPHKTTFLIFGSIIGVVLYLIKL